MLQDIADTAWIHRPEIQPALAAMAQAGLRFDALIKPGHLPGIADLAQRHPGLPVVIDHAAKPDIAAGPFQLWATHMARIARETHWCCKISGLVTEAKPDWKPADLQPYIDHLLAEFGPARLMWGSDWPVVNLAGGYAKWREASLALIPPAAQQEILGATAAGFYGA